MTANWLPLILLDAALAWGEEAVPGPLAAALMLEGDLLGFVVVAAERDRFDWLILEHAQRTRLDPRLVKAVIAVESEFKPTAVSRAGARGLMQLMPKTAAGLGVERSRLHDPGANVRAGTDYLAWLFRVARRGYKLKSGRPKDAPRWVVRRVLAAYNGGPGLLFMDREFWPRESTLYAERVMRLSRAPETALLRRARPRPPAFLGPSLAASAR